MIREKKVNRNNYNNNNNKTKETKKTTRNETNRNDNILFSSAIFVRFSIFFDFYSWISRWPIRFGTYWFLVRVCYWTHQHSTQHTDTHVLVAGDSLAVMKYHVIFFWFFVPLPLCLPISAPFIIHFEHFFVIHAMAHAKTSGQGPRSHSLVRYILEIEEERLHAVVAARQTIRHDARLIGVELSKFDILKIEISCEIIFNEKTRHIR